MKVKKAKILALSILALFLISLVPVVGITAGLEDDKKAAESKIEEFKSAITAAQGKVDEIFNKVTEVEGQIKTLESTIATLYTEKVKLEKDIVVKEQEVKVATEKFDKKKEDVYNRARQVYEDGDVDYTSVILESENLTDFINSSEYYTIMKEKETNKVNEVKKERERLKEQKVALETSKVALENNKKEAETKKGSLSVEKEKLSASKTEIEAAKATISQQLNAEQATLAEINAKLNQAVATYGGPTNYTGNGQFTWPAPSSTMVISEYGGRWGTLHAGMDIGAPAGTPIVAAESGTVVMAEAGGWGGGFGTFVVINHGGGLMTLYGHMSSLSVSPGQSVSRGQTIGTVGNTGNSFGAHLHFQVTNCGDIYTGTVNPRNYL
ncbi:hypothetical protein AZF37_09345 [endosymbiont 'TC1' of Trimyema compressum]|uniref:murein hydrolase activator EnvC family protein n=1 Tax=endosymbiont 'TC1' of Trimyema compressum TaxID=243899 RepID=UPI0007F1802B|nr:peptidoglycan DD-metalloendopeptidase family protein [endosymbiont 'TC1' of Trimyema compressum]AMP21322.1 hypothetical protein AZF37_09345 [endosymbiont 'TC1' of Trimyema compressum]